MFYQFSRLTSRLSAASDSNVNYKADLFTWSTHSFFDFDYKGTKNFGDVQNYLQLVLLR